MSDLESSSDQSDTKKRRKGRSPAYPFISVKRALEQAHALYDQEDKYFAPLPSAFEAWGYGVKSSGGRQTLAALKYFSLIDIDGEGQGRKVKVSDVALRILLDEREDASERESLIRQISLQPVVHKRIVDQFPEGLPSDGTVKHFLMFECGFNDSGAVEVLDQFKETARFAKLFDQRTNANASEKADEGRNEQFPSGTLVQWEQAGVLQLPEPWKVVRTEKDESSGKMYLWCESPDGSESGFIPMDEVITNEISTPDINPIRKDFLPPSLKRKDENDTQEDPPKGIRKATFPLDEGDVTIWFPEGLSADGYDELDGYLKVFMRKAKRQAEGS